MYAVREIAGLISFVRKYIQLKVCRQEYSLILQLLSYHLSIAQSINPDMPRNLAKVVTVD